MQEADFSAAAGVGGPWAVEPWPRGLATDIMSQNLYCATSDMSKALRIVDHVLNAVDRNGSGLSNRSEFHVPRIRGSPKPVAFPGVVDGINAIEKGSSYTIPTKQSNVAKSQDHLAKVKDNNLIDLHLRKKYAD